MTDLKEKKTSGLSMKTTRLLFIISVLILPTIGFLVFFVYVNFDSILMAFQQPDYSGVKMVERFTLDNFRKIFNAGGADFKEVTLALRNTLLFFFADLLIVFPLSIVMSFFFFKKISGYKAFRFIYYLPTIISSSVLVILFKYSIGTGGVYDAYRHHHGMGFYSLLSHEPDALLTILFYNVMFAFGGNIIVIGGSMNGTSSEILEAGKIDGCGWTRELVSLIIPMMWPTISTMLILRCASILSASGPILAFTKGEKGTMTLSYLLYALVSGEGKTRDLYYASAVGIMMTLVVFPIAMLIKHFIYSDKRDMEVTL